MNSRYPSTFRLTYYNDNGEVVGEPLTIDLTDEATLAFSSSIRLWLDGKRLRFKINSSSPDSMQRPFLIRNMANALYGKNGMIGGTEGSVDVAELPSGVYTFSTIIDGKHCSVKWTK